MVDLIWCINLCVVGYCRNMNEDFLHLKSVENTCERTQARTWLLCRQAVCVSRVGVRHVSYRCEKTAMSLRPECVDSLIGRIEILG